MVNRLIHLNCPRSILCEAGGRNCPLSLDEKWDELLDRFYARYPYMHPLLLVAAVVVMIGGVAIIGFWGA